MTGRERVRNTILGLPTDRQPIYGWVFANLTDPITEAFGSVEAFEDHYEFDIAHIFGGPRCFNWEVLDRIRDENGGVLTPDRLVDADILLSPDAEAEYASMAASIAHHQARGRFTYVQTPGFFEHYNDLFGIENHLMYTALYPDELGEIYRRQAEWTIRFVDRCIALGVDCIHISDDWGAQNNMLFSPQFWWDYIQPPMKRVVDYVHSKGVFASLHSDGNVMGVADGIQQLGFDMVHPWQENAGMSYDTYLEKYADSFAILGGVCVQSAIGLLPQEQLEAEIRRVFGLLKGKRWICCTSHFVQDHCTIEDLKFAYDLIYKLARE